MADKSRVDPIFSNFVVLCIDGNIPKRLTRGVLIGWLVLVGRFWLAGFGRLVFPVSTMVEPLLLTRALAGAKKTESSRVRCACIGTLFVPGRNIQPRATFSATFPHNLHRTSP